ncbi:hypothetical protein D3C73_1303930 [compost metagenome]
MRFGEVVDLNVIDQVWVSAVDVGHRRCAIHFLHAYTEGVPGQTVSQHAIECAAIDAPPSGSAGVIAEHVAHIGFQLTQSQL